MEKFSRWSERGAVILFRFFNKMENFPLHHNPGNSKFKLLFSCFDLSFNSFFFPFQTFQTVCCTGLNGELLRDIRGNRKIFHEVLKFCEIFENERSFHAPLND